MCVSCKLHLKAIKTTWKVRGSGHHRNTCHGLIFSTSFAREDKLHTACGGKSSIAHYLLLQTGWVSYSEHGVDSWIRGRACFPCVFSLLRVQVEGGRIVYRTTRSDFIHKYSYKSRAALSCFGRKEVWVMEKLLETESALSLMVCFLWLLTSLFVNVLQCLPLPPPISEFQSFLWI